MFSTSSPDSRGPFLSRSALAALGSFMLGIPGCVHTITPPPSPAIVEARQRLAAAPQVRGPCDGQPDELVSDVSFVYAKSELDDVGRTRLGEAKAWLACHPAAIVAVSVKFEPHYRNAGLEGQLTAERGRIVLDALKADGVADSRILHVTSADDVTTAPAARLWIIANGNGF